MYIDKIVLTLVFSRLNDASSLSFYLYVRRSKSLITIMSISLLHWALHCRHVYKPISIVLCPVLGSPVQERDGATGKTPAKGHGDDEESGVSSI